MHTITREELAELAPERWRRQYPVGKLAFADAAAIEFPPAGQRTPEEINRIISKHCGRPNTGWTDPPACSECKRQFDHITQVGEELDYDSETAYLCDACILAIAESIKPTEIAPDELDRMEEGSHDAAELYKWVGQLVAEVRRLTPRPKNPADYYDLSQI